MEKAKYYDQKEKLEKESKIRQKENKNEKLKKRGENVIIYKVFLFTN